MCSNVVVALNIGSCILPRNGPLNVLDKGAHAHICPREGAAAVAAVAGQPVRTPYDEQTLPGVNLSSEFRSCLRAP